MFRACCRLLGQVFQTVIATSLEAVYFLNFWIFPFWYLLLREKYKQQQVTKSEYRCEGETRHHLAVVNWHCVHFSLALTDGNEAFLSEPTRPSLCVRRTNECFLVLEIIQVVTLGQRSCHRRRRKAFDWPKDQKLRVLSPAGNIRALCF